MSSFNCRENFRFFNPFEPETKRSLFHFFLWMIGFYKDPKSPFLVPSDFKYPNKEEVVSGDKIQWINHSTFLVESQGVRFLTDPVWQEKLTFIGPKRHIQPAIKLEELPKVDYVLISHNHYDHLDKTTLRKLKVLQKDLIFIVPCGLKNWFLKNLGDVTVFELDWWEKKKINEVTFIATPAQHFSGRSLFDRDRSLWMGIICEIKGKRFYFAGDTGYNSFHFKKIGEAFGSIDLSLLPIGAYLPRGFMAPVHINPKEAVTIHKEVNSYLSVGGHFGTFKLSKEALEQPPYDLFLALNEEKLSWENFRILRPGQSISW